MDQLNDITGKGKKPRGKCPPHLKTKIRSRWWKGETLLGKCFCCGRSLHYDDADVGHIQAASKGGSWSPENCRLICRTCNSGMRSINMKKYMRQTYPERYEKYYPKDEKPSKPPIRGKGSKGIKGSKRMGRSKEENLLGLGEINFKPPKNDGLF